MNEVAPKTVANRGGFWPAAASGLVCLLAPAATLAIALPDGYLRLRGPEEHFFLAVVLGPYLALGLLAWWRWRHTRDSVAMLLLTLLLAAFGLGLLSAEAAGYRAALAESPRGPDYMRDRYQRMELFIIPVLQWIACAIIGFALCVAAFRRHGTKE